MTSPSAPASDLLPQPSSAAENAEPSDSPDGGASEGDANEPWPIVAELHGGEPQPMSLSSDAPLAEFDSAVSRLLEIMAMVVDPASADLAVHQLDEVAGRLEKLVGDSSLFSSETNQELGTRVSAVKQRLHDEVVPRKKQIPGAAKSLLAPLQRIAAALNALMKHPGG